MLVGTDETAASGDNPVVEQLSIDERMELHDELYLAAVDHLQHANQWPDDAANRHGSRAAELFERALRLSPDNWNAMWALGKARQQLGQHESAYAAFKGAYEHQPGNADVCRELSSECIELGKGTEAVAVAQQACDIDPTDVGLLSNLALALLISGRVDEASITVQEALLRDPHDQIIVGLRALIEAVVRREIAVPTMWPPA